MIRFGFVIFIFILAGCSTKVDQNHGLIPSAMLPTQGWNQKKLAQFTLFYFPIKATSEEIKEVLNLSDVLLSQLESNHVFSFEPEYYQLRFQQILRSPLKIYWVRLQGKKTLPPKQKAKIINRALGCRPLSNREFAFQFQRNGNPFDTNFVEFFNLALSQLAILQKNHPLYPKIFNPTLAAAAGQAEPLSALQLNLLEQKKFIKINQEGFILCLPNPNKFR